jgi:hypothetical protein
MNRREFLVNGALAVGGALVIGRMALLSRSSEAAAMTQHYPFMRTDAEWHKLLTCPIQYPA